MRRRMQAFTIIDLIIALIISGIITGMGYYILQVLNRQITTYQKKVEVFNDFFLFETAWQQDWEKATYIRNTGNLEWTFEFSNGTPVSYRLHNHRLIRHGETYRDTLPVFISNVQYHSNAMQLVEMFDIDLRIAEANVPCTYHKTYPAKDLLLQNKK
jgi:hypothetical protein